MNYTPEEIKLNRARLVFALLSGEYQQGRGGLRNHRGYCCLGVACDIFDPAKWIGGDSGTFAPSHYHLTGWSDSDIYPPVPVLEYFGLTTWEAQALAQNNDGAQAAQLGPEGEAQYIVEPKNFDTIAKYIASNTIPGFAYAKDMPAVLPAYPVLPCPLVGEENDYG